MRLRLAAVVLLASVAGLSSASAAGLSGMGKAIFGNSTFKFTKANLSKVPVDVIGVGPIKVELQRTRLGAIKKAFGGTQRSEGGATWLCYSTDGSNGPAANVWFLSNALGGHEFVMMVAAELAKGGAGDCDPAPEQFALPAFGIPSLGASAAELKDAFGTVPTSRGAISYRADEPGRDALGTALNVQYLGYLMNRTVTAIGVGEGSAQIPR